MKRGNTNLVHNLNNSCGYGFVEVVNANENGLLVKAKACLDIEAIEVLEKTFEILKALQSIVVNVGSIKCKRCFMVN